MARLPCQNLIWIKAGCRSSRHGPVDGCGIGRSGAPRPGGFHRRSLCDRAAWRVRRFEHGAVARSVVESLRRACRHVQADRVSAVLGRSGSRGSCGLPSRRGALGGRSLMRPSWPQSVVPDDARRHSRTTVPRTSAVAPGRALASNGSLHRVAMGARGAARWRRVRWPAPAYCAGSFARRTVASGPRLSSTASTGGVTIEVSSDIATMTA